MERDFLGLNSKDSMAMLKEETLDGCKDQMSMGGSEMPRPFPNKVSALPHFMPFKSVEEERPKKIIFDLLNSSAFQPTVPTNLFNSNHRFSGVSQAYPFNSVDASHRSHEIRTFPVYNPSFSIATTNPFFKVHGAIGGPNVRANSTGQQPLGGIPVIKPHPVVPFMGSVAGTYAARNASKPVAESAQLTIFYAGSVNVYEDISPEKAQAIMFLAGNRSPQTANDLPPRMEVLSLAPKCVGNGVHGNETVATTVCSGHSSPISVTSIPGAQSGGTSCNTDDLISLKTTGALAPISQPEPLKIVTSVGSTAGTLMPAAVPQARKASLARFLEKRKER